MILDFICSDLILFCLYFDRILIYIYIFLLILDFLELILISKENIDIIEIYINITNARGSKNYEIDVYRFLL